MAGDEDCPRPSKLWGRVHINARDRSRVGCELVLRPGFLSPSLDASNGVTSLTRRDAIGQHSDQRRRARSERTPPRAPTTPSSDQQGLAMAHFERLAHTTRLAP